MSISSLRGKVMPISIPVGAAGASVPGILHAAKGGGGGSGISGASAGAAVILLSGAGGGLSGPSYVYPALGEDLAAKGTDALRLDYRRPAVLEPCLEDVRAAIAFLKERGKSKVGVVGWSFGAAPALQSGQRFPEVAAVATVAAQTAQIRDVKALSRKISPAAPVPLLLLHGTGDTCLNYRCSQSIFESAGEPKTLQLFEGGDHGLTQFAEEMRSRLGDFFVGALAAGAGAASSTSATVGASSGQPLSSAMAAGRQQQR